jgi:2',3'-cyclic-nucleotide 2'-phosphodiesterase (5'-nucleotidase family)
MMRIYHTSDLHDRRGFAGRLQALRSDAPGIYVDCGDSLRGSQTMFYRSEPIIAELDSAGCDVQAMGNREFNYLFGVVRGRAKQMHHPLVCSNLIDTRGRDLPFARTHALVLSDCVWQWRVRFCALLVPQYREGSRWERVFGWRFLDPYEVAAEFAAQVDSAETLIVLSHLGLIADRVLASRVPRIDLILGGHSHDTTRSPERVAGVPIAHAGPYGRYVSRTELARDSGDGRARIARFDLLPLLDGASS